MNVNNKVIDEGVTSDEGLISISHPLAADVGRQILDKGGNAIDAVIAMQLSLNVVEPFTSGIGGGGYLLYFDNKTKKVKAFDARETAPQNIDRHFYLDDKGNHKSFFDLSTHGKTVAIPAIPRLFEHLQKNYSNLTLSELINPAIEQAEKGHKANWATEKYSKHQIERINKFKETHRVYTNNEGDYFHKDDWITFPDIAKTFRIIRDQGFEAFYTSEIADKLVDIVHENGGTITKKDLLEYQIQIKEPVTSNYRGYDIYGMGPSSSGGITVIQILKLLEQFDISAMGPRSTDYLHHLIESMHIAYSDRASFLADESFYDIPVEALIDETYLKERSKLIHTNHANFEIGPGSAIPSVESHTDIDEKHTETTHFSVTDKDGNIASFTTSIGMIYGSGMTIPGYGILLNTTIDGFDVVEGGINEIEANKRSLSNMSPTIVTKEGHPVLEVGAPGAISIIASVVQTLVNVIDFDMTIQQAIEEPRIYTSNPSRIEWERQFKQSTILKLIAKGHAFELTPEDYIGDVHGLQFDIEKGLVRGGTDDTREGVVIGKNDKYVSSQEAPIERSEASPFQVYLNKVELPLFKSQTKIIDNEFFLLTEITQYIFNIEVNNKYSRIIEGQEFVNIAAFAKSLEYKVIKNEKNIFLYKDFEQRIDENEAEYYRYDKESITR
ncbi:gamma-glutamyltransferase [Staphylococcus gallinarum]|uniref:gamma-glutamyltransferase n=1 Tax=Staphylococcus gallinarum TaxID=1293 RepID=UPI001E637166|nr:gamma-glutamyltransferase [Staphylococcus gallinarum]